MSQWKYIDHEGYSAPTQHRQKVKGAWVYTKLTKRVRDFRQKVLRRLSSMSRALRWAPHASVAFKTYSDVDQLVNQLIEQGEAQPSTMAKKKFFVHRPKPANNIAKNRAKRASRVQIVSTWKGKGNKPEPALVINAAQVRIQMGRENIKAHRRITADRSRGLRNNTWYSQSGIGDRECARRRRQMGKAA